MEKQLFTFKLKLYEQSNRGHSIQCQKLVVVPDLRTIIHRHGNCDFRLASGQLRESQYRFQYPYDWQWIQPNRLFNFEQQAAKRMGMDPRVGDYRCRAWNLPAPFSRRHHGNTAIFSWAFG
jgi:hypothetical protein